MKKSKATRAFLVSLAAVLLCSLLNWGIISDWGKVDITRLTLIGDDGMQYSALMYVPENATNATPAPGMLFLHGASGSGRNHESWAMEFSRRGFVCLSIDNYGSGDGEWEFRDPDGEVNVELGHFGVPELFFNYLADSPIVDHDRIITAGHSAGVRSAYYLANKYDTLGCMLACTIIEAKGTPESHYDGNILSLRGSADNPAETYRKQVTEVFQSHGTDVEQVEFDTLYGSFEEGNARYSTYIPGMIHEGAFVNSDCIRELLDFAQKCVGEDKVPNYIAATDQHWLAKDFMGLLGMAVFLAWLLCLAVFLMEKVPTFGYVKQPMPENRGLRGKDLAISFVAAVVFPIIAMYTGGLYVGKLLGATLNTSNCKVFTMGISNRAFSYVIGISILGFAMLLLYSKLMKPSLRELGLTSEGSDKLDWRLIGSAFLLAVTVLFIGWSYLNLQGDILGTDFYCFFFGVKPVAVKKFLHYIPYMVVWAAAFIVASIGMNVERRLPSTGSEKKDLVIAMVVNTLANMLVITAIIILQNWLQTHVWVSGPKVMASWGVDPVRVWGMPVGMTLAGAGQTWCYRKTGNVWLGVFLMGMFCALCCVLYGQTPFNAQFAPVG